MLSRRIVLRPQQSVLLVCLQLSLIAQPPECSRLPPVEPFVFHYHRTSESSAARLQIRVHAPFNLTVVASPALHHSLVIIRGWWLSYLVDTKHTYTLCFSLHHNKKYYSTFQSCTSRLVHLCTFSRYLMAQIRG